MQTRESIGTKGEPLQPAARPDHVSVRSRGSEKGESVLSSPRRIESVIHGSPRLVAQRRRIEGTMGGVLQRVGMEEEEPLQGMGLEEEEPLQGRFHPEGGPSGAMEGGRDGSPGGGPSGALPEPLRAGIEALSGVDLADVSVHANSDRPAQLNALAYAQGSEIHLGPGQEKHLPHEAFHVVQQRQGRVQPTMEVGGVPVNDDPGLEQEAEAMGAKAAEFRLE
jgi:hypothetical protein